MGVHHVCRLYAAWPGACGVAHPGQAVSTAVTAMVGSQHFLPARNACHAANAVVWHEMNEISIQSMFPFLL